MDLNPGVSWIDGDLLIATASGSLRVRTKAIADSVTGAAEMSASLGAPILLSGGTITFTLTSSIINGGGTLASPLHLAFSVFRISA